MTRSLRMGMSGVAVPMRRPWSRRLVVVAVATALLASLLPSPPAQAVTIRTVDSQRVLGELTVDRLQVTINGRTVRGDLLRLPREAPHLELRPRLGREVAVGLETMHSMSQTERSRGAIAGVNGGYFTLRPTGTPNGLFIQRNRMVAADSSLRSGLPAGRAVAGIRQDGRLVADRLRVHLDLDVPAVAIDGLSIDELNRQPRTSGDLTHPVSGELLMFDRLYGRSFRVPAGSVLLVTDELMLGSSGRTTGLVRERRTPESDSHWTPPEGTSAILAYGTSAPLLGGIQPGMALGVTSRVEPFGGDVSNWADLRASVPGAGLLIRNARLSSGAAMSSEGIDHASNRRARTAIGQTSDGTTLMLTIDERGGSGGVTLFELAQIMERLGAVDAVAMDGGGSTHMTVDGQTRNTPSDLNRSHSSAWFVYAPRPPASRGLEAACPPGAVVPGAFEDTAATVHAAAIDCLSWWGVTSGVTLTSYAPAQGVTRAQMASFLARWIDGVNARGDGAPLPASAPMDFTDVRSDSVHANAIARLSWVGVIQGRTSTTFDPGAPVTRAETATLLSRAIGHVQGTPLPAARDTFVDDNGSVHEPAIDRLAHIGVIGGVGAFSFRPNHKVSRAAMASMVMRASDWMVEQGRTTPPPT